MRKVPFYLVTGFLGSGKTTFLINLLQQHAHTRKIGIVQNEFAPAGIDGIALKETGLPHEMLGFNNGSVFCVCLLGDFICSLAKFVNDVQPDAVFLESSGLSDPIAVAQLFRFPPLSDLLYLSHIWCIIDSVNFGRKTGAEIQITRQVRIADTVILNKADLAAGDLELTRKKISGWNPQAEILSSVYCKLPLDNLFAPFTVLPLAIRMRDENRSFERCGRPDDIKTAVLKTAQKISAENLALFIRNEAPGKYRIKGYVRLTTGKTAAVQSSFGLTNVVEVDGYDGITEIIFIGLEVNASEINKRFKALAS